MFGIATETDTFELDPIIAGMVKRLPDANAVWATADRKQWLATLEANFNIVYRDIETTSK